MNCDGRDVYEMTDFYKTYFNKTFPLDYQQHIETDMIKVIYDTQGRLKDHTVMDAYSKAFQNQRKCVDTPKYADFICPCFKNRCHNKLGTDDISRHVTDIRYYKKK